MKKIVFLYFQLKKDRLSGKLFLLFLTISCCTSVAQRKIPVEYYLNNTKQPTEDISLFIATKSDTIPAEMIKGKIKFSWDFKDNFSLLGKIDGHLITIGSYRPENFTEIDKIVVGRITDFSSMKKSWEFNDTFSIGKNHYLILIENSQNILDCIYSITILMVDISDNTDYLRMVPTFTTVHEIIKKKT